MPCHLSGFLKVVMVLSCGLLGGLTVWAQEADGQAVERYRELLVEVLEARLQAEVVPEGNRIRLRTSPNRLLKTMRDVVRASAPYYFEGGIGEFRRFSARVTEGISELDGQTLSSTPRGWTEEDWRYYEVERAIQDVMILVAMDVGVYANGFLSGEVRTRSDLARDWEDLQGGSDPLSPEPLPDFGGGARDESSLDGLGGGSSTNPDDDALRALEAAIRELIGRVEALERGGTPRPPGGGVSGGGFPTAGPDGGWSPGGRTMFPGGLPESFTLSFPEGSAALGLSAEYSLNTLVEWMAARPDLRVLVTGHSDATGSERTNMELSRRRAQVVRYYLLERGVSPERVASAHFGESRPEWGGAFDRRVEVRLLVD